MVLRIALGLCAALLASFPAWSGPDVQVIRLGKSEQKGTLESIGEDGTLSIRTGDQVEKVPLSEVVEVLFQPGEFPPDPSQAQLRL
ncbi:MAG: hypothetical protein ACYS47_14810, partial [Planctomycetota bacterium]